MAEQPAVRTLLPSERERGAVPAPPAAAIAPQPPQRPGPRTAGLRDLIRAMDIRQFRASGIGVPILFLAWFSLVYQLDQTAFVLFIPEIKYDLGVNVGLMTFLVATLLVLTQAAAPFMGFIADRVRRVPFLAAGAVVAHASIAWTGLSHSVTSLALSRVVGATGELVRQPVGFSLAADWTHPAGRARTFTLTFIGFQFGAILGPVTAALIGNVAGWRASLTGLGVLAALVSISFFFLKEPVRGYTDRLAAGADPESAAKQQRPIGWTEAWRAAWSIRTLRAICLATPFLATAGGIVVVFTPLYYASQFRLDPLGRSIYFSLAAIPAIPGLLLSGPVTDRLLAYKPGRVMTALAGIVALQALSLWIFVNTPYLAVAAIADMVPTFCGALIAPALNTALTLILPVRIRGLGLQTIGPWAAPSVPIFGALSYIAGSQGIGQAVDYLVPILLIGAVIIGFAGNGFEADIKAAAAANLAEEALRESRREGRSKLLVCRGVEVEYDGAQVLFGVDLDLEDGDLVALLGTNGAGKSTLLRAITGVQHASSGAIYLDGDDITHLPPHLVAARGVVMMPGGQAVFPTLTVRENLEMAGWLYRHESGYEAARVAEVLARFPILRERLHTQAGNLSGGEQHMVALGQALLMRPRLLMIDELSLGLAPHVVESLLDALRDINAQGTTVVLVEQSINVALSIARRAVYMERGRVQFDGPTAELVARPDIVHSVFLGGASTSGSLRTARTPLDDEIEAVLDVRGLEVSHGGIRALNGVSLSANRGEIVGIIGPNGAGKTTLFDVIAGFVPPAAGSIEFLGRDVARLGPDARSRLGLARSYQSVRLFPALTVRENIAVALERHLQSRNAVLAAVWSPITRRSEKRVARRVENLVDTLGLQPYADSFVSELSTGTRRVVDIACVLATQPRLLLLDEPSSGLAQAETEQLGPVIERIVKETGCALLVIEHDLGLVASVSDRLIAMRLGEVMAEGTPAEVLGRADVVDAILGGSSDAVRSRSIALTTATT